MKRAITYLLVTIAIVSVMVVIGAGAWLVGTTEGAEWLLALVSRHTGGKIAVRRVEGRLLDHLRLEGVLVRLPQKEGQVDSLDLRWQPLFLLGGMVSVKELILHNVRIQDNSPVPEKEPVLAWPRVPAMIELLEASVRRIEIDTLTYRRLDRTPIRIATVATSVTWRESILSMSDLTAISPQGRIAGNVAAGLVDPSLQADLAITPTRPAAHMNIFFLHTRLLPRRGAEQVVGTVTVSGRSGETQRLELTGEVGLAGNAINLRKLRLITHGRRGSMTGEGRVVLTAREPLLNLRVRVAGIDLSPEIKKPTDISGDITVSGAVSDYRGHFSLTNKGKDWQKVAVSADYGGNRSGLTLSSLKGSLLDGTVAGNLFVGWSEGLSVKGALSGSNLNPQRLASDWRGVVNFEVAGTAAWSKEVPLRGEIHGTLLDSSLHDQPLRGEVQASFARGNLIVGSLALQGKGFDLHASGQFDKRLDVAARVADLSLLVPETEGELSADGWLRWRNGRAAGELSGTGRNLVVGELAVGAMKMAVSLKEEAGYPAHIAATVNDMVYGDVQADSAMVKAEGTLAKHSADLTLHSTGAEARLALDGGYGEGTWRGRLLRLSGRDSIGPWNLKAPATVVVSAEKVSVTPIALVGLPLESLELEGEVARHPLRGGMRAEWHDLNLSRVNPWVSEVQVTGSSTGKVRCQLAAGGGISLAGTASAVGTITAEDHSIRIKQSSLSIDAGERGIHATVELLQGDGGRLKGTAASSAPARLALPDEGNIALELAGIDMQLLRPWLPENLNLHGILEGKGSGKFLQGQRLELEGTATLARARVQWQKPAGELNADLRDASASWTWRGDALRGAFTFALAENGQAKGSFQLPLPARLPVSLDRKGSLHVSLTGHVRENGLLTTLFPGLVQESHGEVDADVRVTGTMAAPNLAGTFKLTKAGAYFPTAGIHAEDVQLAAHVEQDTIHIDAFQATSGPGRLNGDAVIQLKGWQVATYRGTIHGDKFRTVYFPELQVLSSPQLTFEGTPEKLVVRGEIRLPELLVHGAPTRNKAIEPSKDVVVEGVKPPAKKTFPLALDIDVHVALGDRVLVKAEGIDAQLGGAMDLSLRSVDRITSKGEIKVLKGNYKTYGVNLQIVRGRIFYAGGPVGQPTLDILALRTIGEVRAGVTIAGTPQVPIIKLYSEPAMPDVDILAYMVLGHPLGSSSGEQAGLMAGAAAALLSAGQSAVLQDEIKTRLGLSTLGIETTTGETTGLMGYKEVQVTPPGKAPAKQTTVSQTMLTVGKYLTPQLYISYGRSLFTGGNLFRLRYDISKHWQVQSETGSESGADIYYKIDFK